MTNEQNPFDVQGFNASFSELYKKLADEEAVVCAKTGETLEQLNSPDAAILGVSKAVNSSWTFFVKVYIHFPRSLDMLYFWPYMSIARGQSRCSLGTPDLSPLPSSCLALQAPIKVGT